MSIKSNLSYLNYIKESGISAFLQNLPNIRYKEKEKNHKISPINISNINSLNELETYINQSNICLLKSTASKTVFADGNASSKIMLIGEAPGAEEDKMGKPFVGLAGKLLNKMLASINLDRNNVYITNIIPWRPPNNRTPNSEEILQCLPFIQKHIEIIKPKLIILLGGTASKAILSSTHGIMRMRGKWYEYNNLNLNNPIPVRAIYHPAFLLRSPENKRETWEDLKEIQKKLNAINEKN
tara:strand:- start:175 stop:894 length:720 start_codon:yes stop_codon:yes gene_type:complete